jgi:hypothetical protein
MLELGALDDLRTALARDLHERVVGRYLADNKKRLVL